MLILHKFRAFTILELVVVLALSGIVMATVYSVYLVVQKQYKTFYDRSTALGSYTQLKQDMQIQFLKSSRVSFSTDSALLTCETESAVVRYVFMDTCVLRETRYSSDTFALQSRDLSVTSPGNSDLLIDTFRCSFYQGKDTLTLQLTKVYSAEQLINSTENDPTRR